MDKRNKTLIITIGTIALIMFVFIVGNMFKSTEKALLAQNDKVNTVQSLMKELGR